MMNKFIEKTIGKLAAAAPVGWTGRTETLEYGCILFIGITIHIPVILQDTTTVLTCLKSCRGFFKDGKSLHLFQILERYFIASLSEGSF
jgi:hypothetical protein